MPYAAPSPPIPDDASTLVALEGSASGATYSPDRRAGLDRVDGRPLLARYDLARAAARLHPATLARRRRGGLWRWAELLPVRSAVNVVHLGEGATPLLHARRLGRALGLDRLLVKCEGCNPTGSLKARGMAVAVSRARELGASEFVVPSAGNAGGALAAYAAAAGLPATVLMPVDAPLSHRAEVLVCGARLVLVEGTITDCGRLAQGLADLSGACDLATLKEPYRLEGKKTMGFELAEDLGGGAGPDTGGGPPWRLPDVLAYPTGGGTGLIGMWKAFDELEAVGLVGAARPRLVAVQAAGCAPLVRAFDTHAWGAAPWPEAVATRAAGLRVPATVGDALVLQALRASGGTAVAVPEAEIDAHQRLAGRLGLGYVAPESAAVLAALAVLVERDWIDPAEEVVALDTASGVRDPRPPGLPEPPLVAGGEDDPERVLALLG